MASAILGNLPYIPLVIAPVGHTYSYTYTNTYVQIVLFISKFVNSDEICYSFSIERVVQW